jgi:hypothetical protein
MDINVKHVIFEPGKTYLFLDISSTSTDTLVPSLYQCVETRGIEVLTVVATNSAPSFHYLLLSKVLERIFSTQS